MSFTSSLPSPVHSVKKQSTVLVNRAEEKLKLKILAGEDIKKDTDSIDNIHNQIASNVTFEDFIPLRQRDFDIKIPQPSRDDIKSAYDKTTAFLKKLMTDDLQSNNTLGNKTGAISTTIGKHNVNIRTAVQDPLQPARFKKSGKVYTPKLDEEIKPITVLHETNTEQVSAEERAKWKIPTFVSQWKNPNGFTVSRVAGDGMGTGSYEISDGFNKLSNALEKADREAKMRIKEKNEKKRIKYEEDVKEKEDKLKLLASRRRYENRDNKRKEPLRIEKPDFDDQQKNSSNRKKTGVLIEKLRDIAKQEGRDISEKVVLGAAKASKMPELNYDSRLFVKGANSSARHNAEQVYDNPLFVQQDIDSIYRTNYNKLDDRIENESGEMSVMDKVNKESGNENRGPIEFAKSSTDKESVDKSMNGLQK